jgi:hypothetical protein
VNYKITFLTLCLSCWSASAAIIQSTNRISWNYGQNVGVRTNTVFAARTTITDVTQAPYNADNTGATDARAAIQQAMNDAPSNSVVFLPAGYFRVDSSLFFRSDCVTLRGAGTNTVVFCTNSSNGILWVGGGDAIAGGTYNVASGLTIGSTNLVLTNTTGIGVGDIIRLESFVYNPDATWPIFNVAFFQPIIYCPAVVTAIDGTNVTITPPAPIRSPEISKVELLTPRSLNPVFRARIGVGVENIRFTFKDPTSTNYGGGGNIVVMESCFDSWITGCELDNSANYNLQIADAAHLTVRSNKIHKAQSVGSNHGGLLMSDSSAILVEDNIIAETLQPGIEFNGGVSGNVFFGNYFHENLLDVDNHGPHPMMNLWEGNIFGNTLEMDGYFGSGSHQTLLRNQFPSTFLALAFKRWTSYMQVVGNVLGTNGATYSSGYTSEGQGEGNMIIQMGYPNIGNSTFVGTTPPDGWNFPGWIYNTDGGPITNGIFALTNDFINTNVILGNFTNIIGPVASIYPVVFQDPHNTNYYYPDDGQPLLTASAGTLTNLVLNRNVTVSNGWRIFVAGQQAFQQQHPNEKFTHTIHGNYDYVGNAIRWDSGIADHAIPTSFFYSSAPSWWGTNRWPAINPEDSVLVADIPAKLRYVGIGSTPDTSTNNVNPSSLDFGTNLVGTVTNRTFQVYNTGDMDLSGSVSVSSPYSVSNGTYTLAPGATQTVTIAYSPSSAGTHSQNATLSGGGGKTISLLGVATNAPTVPVMIIGTSISGGVSSSGNVSFR